MPVRYHNFGGRLGWNLQKRFPGLSSESYLKLEVYRVFFEGEGDPSASCGEP